MRTSSIATWLLLATMPVAFADQPVPVSAAQFYVIGADGRSVPDPSIRRVRPPPRRVAPAATAPASRPRTAADRREPPRDRYDAFAADRCERFGFHYTADGRCVVPRLPRRRPGM